MIMRTRSARLAALLTLSIFLGWSPLPALAQSATAGAEASVPGPVRLRQPQQPLQQPAAEGSTRAAGEGLLRPGEDRREFAEPPPRYRPGEFEEYVQRLLDDMSFRRFGADLVIDKVDDGRGKSELPAALPPDYRLFPADEVFVAYWGGVDADLRLQIDRSGRVAIPRVGTVMLAGLTVAEATAAIERQSRRVFKNFEVSVTLGQLRNVRVFVTGFATRPGAHHVSALTSLSSLLLGRAGGPTHAGSFRDIELRRGGRTIAKLDLYDLMLFGKRDADQLLQAEDVVHVGPVGPQVALIGSVNKPALFELRQGETLRELLRMAGGFSAVADRSRVAVERLGERTGARIRELSLPRDEEQALGAGDLVRVFSAIDAALPQERQNKRVRIEGEVNRPGDYILPPISTVAEALRASGGLTPAAYIFGTEFSRRSVQQTQQVNYERALRDLELEIAKRGTTTTARTNEELASVSASQLANDRLLSRLREARPSGRVVLQLTPDAAELPNLLLEDGDRLKIPPRPNSVGVFGSVFNGGSYLFLPQRTLSDYLRLAGDTTKGADLDSVFIVRANGSVMSARQGLDSRWFSRSRESFLSQQVFPGDTVFVPEELNKTTFLQAAKDWTQVLSQFGLGVAAFKVLLP